MRRIYNEGGINWNWFTELDVNPDNSVTIVAHYRLHLDDIWPQANIDAPHHPSYFHERTWKETDGRIAIAYFIPELGWCNITNPKYIFGYGR